MKIVIITVNIYGGLLHYVSQLANALSKTENVFVIAPVGVERKTFTKDVKIVEIPMGNRIKSFFVNTLIFTRALFFLRTIHKIKPEVIHFQGNHLWFTFFLPFLKKFPIVTTLHDVNPHIGSRKFDQIIGKDLCINFSDCLIVHGKAAKKELKTNKKCFVIPHGDYSFFLNYAKDNIKEEENNILFFGRIEVYKGLEYLIKSIIYIVPEIPNIKLVIVGSGDFTSYRNLIQNDKNYEVHNRYIAEEEVPSFFQKAKIVVLPYIECTQSGVIPISYAFKKPVVVTNVGSIPEVVDDGRTGFVVPSRDAKAIARAIIKLLKDDKLRRQMGENAYKKMQEELSWDKIAVKTSEIYKRIIDDKSCK